MATRVSEIGRPGWGRSGGSRGRTSLALVAALLTIGACLAGCASSGPGAERYEARLTLIETEPAGASVFLEGGFVGTPPASFMMPARPEVTIRIERPGYQFVEELLRRRADVPPDAQEGVGWETSYFWPLTPKRH